MATVMHNVSSEDIFLYLKQEKPFGEKEDKSSIQNNHMKKIFRLLYIYRKAVFL